MNVVTRGIKNALRSPLRSVAIIAMLAISIVLIVAMLVARAGVTQKINEVKSNSATTVAVRAAGIMGGMGGGDPLTADQIAKIKATSHVASTVSTLTDQLGTDDTNLTSSLELGSFGMRMQRFESSNSQTPQPQIMISPEGESADTNRPAPTPRTTITGTTNPDSVATDGAALTISSGKTIDGNTTELVALVGKSLATKNNLAVGGTFTAYGKTFTVQGIYDTGNTFQDSGIIIPLATLQSVTDQAGLATSVTVTVDSADNVASVVSTLQSALGDKADITSQQEQAASSVASLQSISNLATTGVIGATIAAAVIVLLTMTMIVRERRREIGVIKAIGGTNFKVIVQFVTEALTLTIVGGIIGLGVGVMASDSITQLLVSNQTQSNERPSRQGPGGFGGRAMMQIDQSIKDVSTTVTPLTFASAAGITLLIAIIGSAVPAWLIARIRPAEVLRTE
jgi:putative ABC transport system permease protein